MGYRPSFELGSIYGVWIIDGIGTQEMQDAARSQDGEYVGWRLSLA